jgi:hypothetical protein
MLDIGKTHLHHVYRTALTMSDVMFSCTVLLHCINCSLYSMILMCTPAVVQFSVQAFDAYASSAEINSFFNVQVCMYAVCFLYMFSSCVIGCMNTSSEL